MTTHRLARIVIRTIAGSPRTRIGAMIAIALSVCLAPRASAEDCFDAAYRYCCDLIPEFVVPCSGAEGGQCTGVVDGGDNDFHKTLVPGQFTNPSFDTENVDYSCTFFAPICATNPPPYCDWEEDSDMIRCIAWKLKQTWFMCEEV